MTCPFCALTPERIVISNLHGMVIRDTFPVSPGHMLVIPRRHVGSFFEIENAERDELMALQEEAKRQLDKDFKPAGYNIGINDGAVAGQTVPHLHIHLIPRYENEGKDPRGGVRWVIPKKADYWT
jgi:diadenosine tetraphosphate (Ap4A) HIT family hydrolase